MLSFGATLLRVLPPETAHHLAINLLRYLPVSNQISDLDFNLLQQEYCGLAFSHPLGLAAGFDKDAEVYDKLGQLGFSFVEIGSVTPLPQLGNPKPRLFRLSKQQAIINRYGFNSAGLERVRENLQRYPHTCITGINLGKNKNTLNDIDDFLFGAEQLLDQGDYFTVNVSSPNTPGLRDLQNPKFLKPLLEGVKNILSNKNKKIPLFVKLSPDMELTQETKLLDFLAQANIDGIIISNTTVSRPGITGKNAAETGGLSGLPIKNLTNNMLARAYAITRGNCVLIGCGGISSGQDAYEKLLLGANLLQLYTAFIFQGPIVLRRILLELKQLLTRDGVKNIGEIIGQNS